MSQAPLHLRAGIKEKQAGYRHSRDVYPDMQVLYILEGKLYLLPEPDFEVCLQPGDVVVLGSETSWTYYCKEKGYKGAFAILMHEEAPPFHSIEWFTCTDRALTFTAKAIAETVAQPGPENVGVLNALGSALLWRALEQIPPQADLMRGHSYGEYWATQVRDAINSQLGNQKPLREIVANMRLSYRQLARYFTETYGLSPKEYRRNARMVDAARQLRDSDHPITYVALELGFASSQHFAREFKRVFRVTPTRYRELARENALDRLPAALEPTKNIYPKR